MMVTRRRWQRRKEARPAEIIESALSAFADKGFAAAKLDDIARDAGVAKGTLYLHFETKEDLFRAVVRTAIAPQIDAIKASAEVFSGPFLKLAPRILLAIALAMEESRLPALVKVVIGESRNFPDLARIWHDDLLSKAIDALSGVIARAQARGELGAGNPRLHVFSLVGPMLMAVLYRSVFAGISNELPDLKELAAQHAKTALAGMLAKRPRTAL
jgi:AcrR family transcriptional regulator